MQNKVRNNRKVLDLNPQQLILKEKIKLCFSRQKCFKKKVTFLKKKYLIKHIASKRMSEMILMSKQTYYWEGQSTLCCFGFYCQGDGNMQRIKRK